HPAIANPVIRLKDAAAAAGICTRTLRRLVARGEGPKVLKLSTQCRGIRRNDLEAWLAEREHV
ncbi:helix-turn-helix transcriptional regulator, partial [Serratia marcescens]|uniref:helix-turn-helix transcriptional regulator n=2 Tax=Pseudomonadota TaxID=1224 RepID=UPI0013DCE096